ncbi:MAG: hypothetical protein IJ668_02850 [Selenomonadaceae bacterium]|nr:hypothetical protein [Selenomonadaceae bacterium]
MIHICYGLYDRDGHYSKFVGTSMTSVFENTGQRVTVHILHDNTLTVGNRDKFIYLAGKYGQRVEFYNVELLAADRIEKIKSYMPEWTKQSFSIGSIYRLIIHEIVRVNKIIYLDSDIIVRRDINSLWKFNIDDYPLAAIPECLNGMEPKKNFWLCNLGIVADGDYFNSGVLVLNIERLKRNEEVLRRGYEFISTRRECQLFDQDILNYCLAAAALKLPAEFNSFVRWERRQGSAVGSKIYHFIGTFLGEGLSFNLDDPFNRLYFDYFTKSPWFGLETLSNVSKAFDETSKAQRASTLNLIKVLGRKERAFFTEHHNIPALKALFEIGDHEMIVDASNSDALMKILNALRPTRGGVDARRYSSSSRAITSRSGISCSVNSSSRASTSSMQCRSSRTSSACRQSLTRSFAPCKTIRRQPRSSAQRERVGEVSA